MEGIVNGIWKITLGRPERLTPVRMREGRMALDGLARLPRASVPPVRVTSMRSRSSARGFIVEIALDPREQIYGFGLQMKSHNQRDLKKTARVNSDPVVDTARDAIFNCRAHRRVRAAADEAIVRKQIGYFRSSGIRCDVFGFEPSWQTHSYSCTYDFEKGVYTLVELAWENDRGSVRRAHRGYPGERYRVTAWEKI